MTGFDITFRITGAIADTGRKATWRAFDTIASIIFTVPVVTYIITGAIADPVKLTRGSAHTIVSIILTGFVATIYITGVIVDHGQKATWCAFFTIAPIHFTEPIVAFFLAGVITDQGSFTRTVTIPCILVTGVIATCYITHAISDVGIKATWCAFCTIASIMVTDPNVTFFFTDVISDLVRPTFRPTFE